MRVLLSLIALTLLCAAPVMAQDAAPERQMGFMMLNQNVCPGEGMSRMLELTEERFAPVLNGLKAEGMLRDWGVLGHAWGDEYNFNWYMSTESHAAWQAAWDEMVRRMSERHPGIFNEVAQLCTRHKDNLYTTYDWDM